jgi:hypothetical protein
MAASEVIYFLLWAQLDSRSLFPVRIPLEPVSEFPP